MATATANRARKTTQTPVAPAKRHGCTCLDLPRMHARGDIGCEYEGDDVPAARPTTASIASRAARDAQQAAWLEATGTDLSELR